METYFAPNVIKRTLEEHGTHVYFTRIITLAFYARSDCIIALFMFVFMTVSLLLRRPLSQPPIKK